MIGIDLQPDGGRLTPLPVTLIHPPVTKPGEPPAGIARLAGALRAAGVACRVVDANIDSFHHWIESAEDTPAADTWSRRAVAARGRHLADLASPSGYVDIDRYRRAVSDLSRVLALAVDPDDARIHISDFKHARFSPMRSRDMTDMAENPEASPYAAYYLDRLIPELPGDSAGIVGISLSFLSQALSAFALIGLIRRHRPRLRVVLGGGLVTSWMRRPDWQNPFGEWVDQWVSGPGETELIALAGGRPVAAPVAPDYSDLMGLPYISPGFVLPYSASAGCWWRQCAFCPEQAESQPFRPIPATAVVNQVRALVAATRPVLIHFLDNALTPRLLRELVRTPPGVPWYGFVRVTHHLEDPEFCQALAASGCVMLKIGLESGSRSVLTAMGKGIDLRQSEQVLENLQQAGIAVYGYLLFGTPAEDEARARETLAFTAGAAASIRFLNLAIFNLPLGSPESRDLSFRPFSNGDLALYGDFVHPRGWDRGNVRRFLDKEFRRHPAIKPILNNDPLFFTSNHAPFFTSGWRRHSVKK